VVWFVWQVSWDQASGLGVVLTFAAAAVAAVSIAVLHHRWQPSFGTPWREVGAGLMLVALFGSAIPDVTTGGFRWTTSLVVGVVVAGLLAIAAVGASNGRARLEPVGVLALAGLAVLLVAWDTGTGTSDIDVADWAHAAVAIGVYVAAAGGVAALGVLRDSWRLTALATTALVVFTTFQSFAVFSAILPGALLFVVLGLVFLATGFLFDRARRELARSLEADAPATEGDHR
jgi:hypothetical protein